MTWIKGSRMAEPSRLRLLVVDDDAQDRALARMVLGQALPTAHIREIEDAEEFASAMRKGRFDLVVTECLLGWTDGLAVLRAVRDTRPSAPVIAFTRLRDEEVVVEAMKAGFVDFVFKGSKGFLQLPSTIQSAWEQATNRVLAARSEPWISTLLDRSNIGVYRATLDGRLIESTPALFRLFGINEIEDALKLDLPEPQFLSEERKDLLQRLNSDQALRTREVRVQNSDGSITWLSLTEVLLVDVDGEIVIDVVVQDISRLKEQEEVVRQKLQELERSNTDLSQFAYMASHELQQPLRMVEKFGEILAEEYGSQLGEEGTELLKSVTDGAHRMQDLVDDLLALSRIDTDGKDFDTVDSNEVIHEAILGIEDLIDESDAEIRSDLLPAVLGDHPQLVQLWRNLISNAIKFRGDEPPKIAIAANENDREWVFHITDNGIGVDSQELQSIFVIFRRLHPNLPGTGIGLSICKRIVERHGGRLWAEALPEGGSRFSFTLPRLETRERNVD